MSTPLLSRKLREGTLLIKQWLYNDGAIERKNRQTNFPIRVLVRHNREIENE